MPFQKGLSLAGYAGRPRHAASQDRPLEANLLFARDEQGFGVLLVSLDLLFVGRVLTEHLRKALAPTIVVGFATHTHSAPSTDSDKPNLGPFEREWAAAVGELLVACARNLVAQRGDAVRVSVAKSTIGESVNRRLPRRWPRLTRRGLRLDRTIMAPNAKGPTADCARLAVLRDADDRPVAAVCSWNCHPTSVRDPTTVSSDFFGPVRSAIRRRLGAIPVLCLQGFAGDVRPPSGRPSRFAALAAAVRGHRFHEMSPDRLALWEAHVSERIASLAVSAGTAATPQSLSVAFHRLSLTEFLDDCPAREFEIGRISFGEAWNIVCLEAEPSVGHIARVQEAFPDAWPVGYAGDVFGYLPTDEQIPDGGYEVRDYMALFGMRGSYRGSIGLALDRALADLRESGCRP